MAKAQKVVLSPEEKAEAKQKRWAQIKRGGCTYYYCPVFCIL